MDTEREHKLEELVRDMNHRLRQLVYDNEPVYEIACAYGQLEQRMEDLGVFEEY